MHQWHDVCITAPALSIAVRINIILVTLLQRLGQEVAQLQAANADLLQDKQEALLLLDAYRYDRQWESPSLGLLPTQACIVKSACSLNSV